MLDPQFMAPIRTQPVSDAERAPEESLRDEDEAVRHDAVANLVLTLQLRILKQPKPPGKNTDFPRKAAVKLYAKAIIFSLIFSLAVIMEGYDTSLIGTFFGFQPFLDKFGDELDPEFAGRRIVSARWQALLTIGSQVSNTISVSFGSLPLSSLTSAAQVGSVIGLCINGWTSEKFGYRKTMFGSLFLMIAFTCMPFFARHLRDHLIGTTPQG